DHVEAGFQQPGTQREVGLDVAARTDRDDDDPDGPPCASSGHHARAGEARGDVSYMRTATTTPEPTVSTATAQIAASTPRASAITPATSAPTAYPASRHSRYTPTAEARHSGWATSPTAASSVGDTIAVP